MMNSDLMISFKNVGCRYSIRAGVLKMRHYDALKSISFDLYKGETLGVIGKNGAGKSTLLRLVAGILHPDSGKIVFNGDFTISLLSLQLGFSEELSGRDNAVMAAMMAGHSKKESISRLSQVKEFSELGSWFEEPLKTYSAGMKARLGFAVAMELSPDVLLVDEVLGVGDEAFRQKSTATLKEKMSGGQTAMLVSHQAQTIEEICTRAVWIEYGQTRTIGLPTDVLKQYHRSATSSRVA